MHRRLFVIEGTDGSGKSTQFELLCTRLDGQDRPYRQIRFPRYGEPSAALIELYLNGAFGENPDAVNPYAASMFFAADRYASFVTDWKADWERGVPILCDRYTTSNAVHQANKLPAGEIDTYLDWLFDFEYQKIGLPEPTCVFFLDMPPEYSRKLLDIRQGEAGDIHERDGGYLLRCYQNALNLCDKYHWRKIACVNDNALRPREEINEEIFGIIGGLLP